MNELIEFFIKFLLSIGVLILIIFALIIISMAWYNQEKNTLKDYYFPCTSGKHILRYGDRLLYICDFVSITGIFYYKATCLRHEKMVEGYDTESLTERLLREAMFREWNV